MRYARTLTSAREHAAQGRLEDWIHAYLLSDGRNEPFSQGLRRAPRQYMGPLTLPLALLERCCGPEPDMRFQVDARGFEAHVAELMRAVEAGEDMPPLIVNYAAGAFTVNDGNHRLEAYKRLGRSECAAIVWTSAPQDAAEFEALAGRGFDMVKRR